MSTKLIMTLVNVDSRRALRVRAKITSRFARVLTVVVLVALFGMAPFQSFAQGKCELALHEASSFFEEGKFTESEQAIQDCFQSTPRRAEKRQAYALLAKIHVAEDDIIGAEAALMKLLDVDPEFQPDLFDSPRFVRLVQQAKSSRTTPVVTSVSKSKESLLEAPATVVVITADEIASRGYVDIEAILHDLPGFDFSRLNGLSYSNIYQRGYRSAETNRTLFLIDGVEENDLASYLPFISRQYPLSNIERIEVVYGPASTMYGANAFAGVINVITKQAEDIVKDGHTFGYDAWITGGSWNTRIVDATVAGKSTSGLLSWTLTARAYESDEYDLSHYEDWDYDPAYYDTVDYQGLSNLNSNDLDTMQGLIDTYGEEAIAAYFTIDKDENGNPTAFTLNSDGASRARALDQSAYDQIVLGHPIGYSNPSDDWYVYGKLTAGNMTFGLQLWRRMEGGSSAITDRGAAGANNGFTFAPEHTILYMKYNRRYLDDKLTLSLSNSFKRHELDPVDSRLAILLNYQRGSRGIENLINGTEPLWLSLVRARSNSQIRSEINLFYDHSEKFNIVGGFELRYSSIGAANIQSLFETPANEVGYPADGGIPLAGGNQISSEDMGLYVQGAYRPIKALKLVAGFRVDNNQIRETGGYGTVFNPRLAAIYSWRDFVFKTIYSEAFQDAPNFQKYSLLAGVRELANPNLAPEEVTNFEISAAWNPFDDITLQLVGYQSNYDGIAEPVSGVPCDLPSCTSDTTQQYQNVGSLDIKGIQADAKWTPGDYTLLFNYSYTNPQNGDGVRVGDIADHRLNLGGRASYWEKLDFDLRVNWVIGRQTGAGTTVASNPYLKIDDYLAAHLAVTYREILPGFDLQLTIGNLLDTEYFDPGIQSADGGFFAARLPQPGRSFMLRLRVNR